MHKTAIIKQTAAYVKQQLYGEGSGHDWWHVYRVWQLAKRLGEAEGGDLFVIELAALLHDIADWKFQKNYDDTIGASRAAQWLTSQSVTPEIIAHVCQIISDLSFKGALVQDNLTTLEGKIVQDADRLDAIGAIGIARCFAYGGAKGRQLHDPDEKPELHQTFDQYKKNTGPSINHFYEKLLLLKDRMNTPAGRRLAAGRHRYMQTYLDEFYAEWRGDK